MTLSRLPAILSPLNLSRIASWISQGRLDPNRTITVRELVLSRCVSRVQDGVKLLADGAEQLTIPIDIIVSRASAQAIAAVERAGGKVTTRYYTPMAVRKIVAGTMESSISLMTHGNDAGRAAMLEGVHRGMHRLPDPTSRKNIEYYRDPAHRGYLRHLLKEGESPSLLFKAPGTGILKEKRGTMTAKRKTSTEDNRMW